VTNRKIDFGAVASDNPKASLGELGNVLRRHVDLKADNSRSDLFLKFIMTLKKRGQIGYVLCADTISDLISVEHCSEESGGVTHFIE